MQTSEAINLLHNELLMQALAAGLEDTDDIFRRFNVPDEVKDKLLKSDIFRKNVAIVRDEMERDGSMTKLRARWMAKDLLEKTFTLAASSDATLDERLEALKTIARIADLESPSKLSQNPQASGFQINIMIPSANPSTPSPVVTVTPSPALPPKDGNN